MINEPSIEALGITLVMDHAGQFYFPGDPVWPRSSVTLEEARILGALAAGRRVLEIGTGLGVSTLFMASLAKSIVTVDPCDWSASNVKLPSHVTRVRCVEHVPPGGFDVAFIDGAHDEGSVIRDIAFVRTRMGSDDVIAFHDSHHVGVKNALERAFSTYRTIVTYPTAGKLTLVKL